MMKGGGKLALHCAGPSGNSHSSFSLQLAHLDPDWMKPLSHWTLHFVIILLVPIEQDSGVTCPFTGAESTGQAEGLH